MSPQGLVVVDKPAGPTSHAVVARARKVFGTRRIGHAGTLDPLATGVLVLGVGSATRLLGHLSDQGKEYLATIVLGIATTTDDVQGDVLTDRGAQVGEDDIQAALAPWRGPVRQRPSAVSAVHVDGKRAHERVRAGENVNLPERDVVIDALDLLDVRHEQMGELPVTLIDVRVACSAGTYVRALARDVGQALETGGHITALRRTRSGALTLEDACLIDDLAEAALLTAGEVARRSLPWTQVPDDQVRSVAHGVRIPWPEAAPATGSVALLHGDELLALAEKRGGLATYSAVWPDAGGA